MDNVLTRNNVKVFGDGSQPLIFAHGFGCDQNMWRFVAPAFAADYKVMLFDHVNSGKSEIAAYCAEPKLKSKPLSPTRASPSRPTFCRTSPSISNKPPPAQTSRRNGLGLGITITRHIVEQHNGTISAASSAGENKSATFTVRLPKTVDRK